MRRIIILIFSACLAALLWTGQAEAAEISVQPSSERVTLGETVVVNVLVDSNRLPMNAVEASIHYPGEFFALEQIHTGDSFIELWPEPPLHQENTRTVHFVGGVPGGTYAFDARALQITLRAIKVGSGNVTVSPDLSGVYLHNGEGTRLAPETSPAKIEVVTPEPYRLGIYSPTHPDQDAWYPERDIILTWEPRADALYSYELSQNTELEPDALPESVLGTVEYADIEDGRHYFTLRERIPGDDWRTVARYRIQIDGTPPEPFTILPTHDRKQFDGKTVISFQSQDHGSGIARYDVIEGADRFAGVRSPYLLHDQQRRHSIRVEAYDHAGNIRIAELPPLSNAAFRSLPWYFWVVFLLVAILLIVRQSMRRRSKA